jgi:hypothetical protein
MDLSGHPIDLIFSGYAAMFRCYVAGLAQPMAGAQLDVAPLIVIVLGTFWGSFIHANLRWRFGWFEYLVSTPYFLPLAPQCPSGEHQQELLGTSVWGGCWRPRRGAGAVDTRPCAGDAREAVVGVELKFALRDLVG